MRIRLILDYFIHWELNLKSSNVDYLLYTYANNIFII